MLAYAPKGTGIEGLPAMADQMTLDEKHRARVEKAIAMFWHRLGKIQIPNDVLIALLDTNRPELLLERFAKEMLALSQPSDVPSSASSKSCGAARHPDRPVRGRPSAT